MVIGKIASWSVAVGNLPITRFAGTRYASRVHSDRITSGWPTNRQQLGISRLNDRTGDHAHIHRVRFSGPLMNGAALDANSCADGRIPGRNLALDLMGWKVVAG